MRRMSARPSAPAARRRAGSWRSAARCGSAGGDVGRVRDDQVVAAAGAVEPVALGKAHRQAEPLRVGARHLQRVGAGVDRMDLQVRAAACCSASAMAPLPVPRSMHARLRGGRPGSRAAQSTSVSVSGRGTSTRAVDLQASGHGIPSRRPGRPPARRPGAARSSVGKARPGAPAASASVSCASSQARSSPGRPSACSKQQLRVEPVDAAALRRRPAPAQMVVGGRVHAAKPDFQLGQLLGLVRRLQRAQHFAQVAVHDEAAACRASG